MTLLLKSASCGCDHAGRLPIIVDGSDSGYKCESYTYSINCSVGCGSGTTYNISGQPAGLTVTSTGFVTGVPTQAGTFTIGLTATNSCGTGTGTLTLTITDRGATCLCGLTLNTAGGDAGYDHTFDTTGDFIFTRNIYVDFESYSVKDQLLIYANGSLVYDSGCIGAHVTPTVVIAAGTTSVRVVVVANCEGTTGTAWTLGITCG